MDVFESNQLFADDNYVDLDFGVKQKQGVLLVFNKIFFISEINF